MQLRSYSVGITTLEEVFLKIGHGEDDAGHDVGAGAPDAYRQLPDLNSAELEDYSIAKEANKSFCDQFREISMKKLKINARTPQTFYQELIIPFVVVILFVAIGQADFFVAYPGLEMTPELFKTTGKFYYNHDYSRVKCPPAKVGTPECLSIPNYLDPDTMVQESVWCSKCEADKLYTEKDRLVISAANLEEAADGSTNETKELEEFESKAFSSRDKENAFIYFHEISYGKAYFDPPNPKAVKPDDLKNVKLYKPY